MFPARPTARRPGWPSISESRGHTCWTVGRSLASAHVRTAGTRSVASTASATPPMASSTVVEGSWTRPPSPVKTDSTTRMRIVTTNCDTCTSATVATAIGVEMPRFVSSRRLSAAGPIPAGAASAT
ncbi:Uncharacterised protein [Mycobacteroides abscessus]|nr:Uncharacterised protein [Mycobacteroides abscessus]